MSVQLELGDQLKEDGCKKVADNNAAYCERFAKAAKWFVGIYEEVTSDDVIARIGMPPGHPSAVGAAMRAFAKREKLRVTGYRKSIRPSCHSAVIAIWSK